MKTPYQVYTKALSLVGALGAGQTASAEDIDVCETALKPLIDELSATNVAHISISVDDNTNEEVPEEYFLTLAKLLANEIAPDFGAPSDETLRQILLDRMRQVGNSGSYAKTQTAEYF